MKEGQSRNGVNVTGRIQRTEAEETAQQARALTALAEDPLPSSHVVVHNHPKPQFQDLTPSSDTQMMHIHRCKQNTLT